MAERSKGKGQTHRLTKQHQESEGVKGIFGEVAKTHDHKTQEATQAVFDCLCREYPENKFRIIRELYKKDINKKLNEIDPRLGVTLFVDRAHILPDGKVIEVLDNDGSWRIILVPEAKHQGKDVENVKAGIKPNKNNDDDLMTAGNAGSDKVHKNIVEVKNLMLGELHFPYVVFLQGSNFATETVTVYTPGNREVKIRHDSGAMNRIDRVTGSSYGMEINVNHCKNIFVGDGNNIMLQIPSFYAKISPWDMHEMCDIMYEIAMTSLEILGDKITSC